MSARAVSATAVQEIRWSRAGDVGLCILLCLFATIQILNTFQAIREGVAVLAIHQALVCIASLIMAGLPLIRGHAVAKGEKWGPKIVAIVGSFIIIPIGLLPMTWQSNWILESSSVGLAIAEIWVIWSLVTLRRSFSIFPEARRLVTHGPYGIVRHPLYLSYFLIYVLVLVPRFSVWSLSLVALAIVAETSRSRNEERILRTTFPEYESYAQRVRAFVPFNRFVSSPRGVTSRVMSAPILNDENDEHIAA